MSPLIPVAVVGAGNMGGGMALNLVKAGHEVWAFDLSAEALARVVAGGATAASSAADAAGGADAIITMLPAGSHVRAAYEGELFAAAQSHAVLIDCSTIDVATAKAMGEAALTAAMAGNWLAPQALVVWEEGSAPALPEGFTLEDQRKYGDTLVTIARAP